MKMFEGESFFISFLGVLNGGVFMIDFHCDFSISTQQDTNLITLYMQRNYKHCNKSSVCRPNST